MSFRAISWLAWSLRHVYSCFWSLSPCKSTDLDGLNAELVTVVRETIQPEHVSLWLRPDTPPKAEKAE